MVKAADQAIPVANSPEELVKLLGDENVFKEGEGKIKLAFLGGKHRSLSKYKIIRTGNNGRRDSRRKDVYVDLTQCIGKGAFATVYRGYLVELEFSDEGEMSHVLSTKPVVVRKIKTADLEKQSGKANAQYFGLITEVKGAKQEKEFTYQIMDQRGLVDLYTCFVAERASKKLRGVAAEYMDICGWSGCGPLLRHQVKGTPEEIFLRFGKDFGELCFSDRVSLTLKLVEALHCLHTVSGLLHLDIKPENIMVALNIKAPIGQRVTEVALIDPDSTKKLSDETTVQMDPKTLTSTLTYMPPEMFFPQKDFSCHMFKAVLKLCPRSDFYSLAGILPQLFWADIERVLSSRHKIEDFLEKNGFYRANLDPDLLYKGYDFSTVLSKGSIGERWREPIRGVVVDLLENLQDRSPRLRPGHDELKDFLTKLYDLALAIDQGEEDTKIEGLLRVLQPSQESKRCAFGY